MVNIKFTTTIALSSILTTKRFAQCGANTAFAYRMIFLAPMIKVEEENTQCVEMGRWVVHSFRNVVNIYWGKS